MSDLRFGDFTGDTRSLGEIVLNIDTRGLIDGIIEERRRSEELRRHRLPMTTRLLFSGPPGCGKTMCAEVIARELSLPLYSARLDVVISSFLGEAGNLRRLFEYASRKPCVLFFDEFDGLARSRSDVAEHNEMRRVVNSLLLMIERFQGPGLVIAATNLPQFSTRHCGGGSMTFLPLSCPASAKLSNCLSGSLQISPSALVSVQRLENLSACLMPN